MKNTWECEGDCFNGEGIKRWKDGGVEKGNWKNGELIGFGYQYFGKTSEFAGDSYEGEFLDVYHGYGKYTDVSEDAVYTGEWENGKADGKGKVIFGKNSKHPYGYYDGEWKNGKRHGYGIKYWGESGQWANNKYEGEWKDDVMDGHGRCDWADGGYYIGEWENGEQHGKGTYTFPDGEKLESTWEKGYCRELAIKLWGESASTFSALIGQLNDSTYTSGQKFIDALTIACKELSSDPQCSIDFEKLKYLYDSARKDNLTALSKLTFIEEYDDEIKLKIEYTYVLLAVQELFNELNDWFEITESGDFAAIEKINEKIAAKAVLLAQQQTKFKKTEKRFDEKYSK